MASILLVEDDPDLRSLTALVLGSGGHAVREAEGAEQGLRMARNEAPDLVVCDVVMPGMNGYQFVAAVRDDPRLCTIPVVLLTSLSERAQVRVGMMAGADDYLAKPLQPKELLDSVEALLRRRSAQAEAIASRYESQMLHEINARWRQDLQAGRELRIPDATVLLADLFDVVHHHAQGRDDTAALLKRAHEAACDAVYLFGASHVVPHGGDLLVVFGPAREGRPAAAACLRAASALHAAVARVLGTSPPSRPIVAMALECGPFSLVRLQDPLHGDGGCAVVPGATLERLLALRQLARHRGWWLTTSAVAAQWLPAAAMSGTSERIAHLDLDAQELRKPGS